MPVSKAAKLVTPTEHRCRLPGRTEHDPVKFADPTCSPEACSVGSLLNQNARGVVVEVA